jgi:hypothetical protein
MPRSGSDRRHDRRLDLPLPQQGWDRQMRGPAPVLVGHTRTGGANRLVDRPRQMRPVEDGSRLGEVQRRLRLDPLRAITEYRLASGLIAAYLLGGGEVSRPTTSASPKVATYRRWASRCRPRRPTGATSVATTPTLPSIPPAWSRLGIHPPLGPTSRCAGGGWGAGDARLRRGATPGPATAKQSHRDQASG